MKTDRLIGILSVLLQREKVTAPELARQFEVSRRTINRDIEALCIAGIPIRTVQGAGGGICIEDGYRMDRTLLTPKDMQMILAGLRSLDSVSVSRYCSRLMEKLKIGSSGFAGGEDSIRIDLSSWYRGAIASKIELIQEAVEKRRHLTFRYYAPGRDSVRTVEPCYLIFQWSSWYLWGWCGERRDFRLFKLNRMEELFIEETVFEPREPVEPDLSDQRIFPGNIRVKALFDPDVKWRLVEEFGTGSFAETRDGRLLFTGDYTNRQQLLSWLLSFGDQVLVLEPADVRAELIEKAAAMLARYRQA